MSSTRDALRFLAMEKRVAELTEQAIKFAVELDRQKECIEGLTERAQQHEIARTRDAIGANAKTRGARF